MPACPEPQAGLLMIISGPSGVGKSTLTNALLQRLDADLSISMTTRPATAGEREGRDYFFVDTPAFEASIAQGELLEHALYNANYYGTPRRFVCDRLEQGRLVILEIDVEGAHQIKQSMPDCFAVFIDPPSEQALQKRLRARKRDDEETIQRRLSLAHREIHFAHDSSVYDAFVVNDDFERAVGEIERLLQQKRAAMRQATLFDAPRDPGP